MSKQVIVKVVVEGQTEEKFIKEIVAPFLRTRNIIIKPTVLTKKGQNGGDVKFERVKRDVLSHLKGKEATHVSYFVDYYGLKEWPNKDSIPAHSSPQQIADILNQAATAELEKERDSDKLNIKQRFLPYMAVHEFEALLFRNSQILADEMSVSITTVEHVLAECGTPEQINNSPNTAPSKRLEQWKPDYSKTTDGIAIAHKIGLNTMREKCPLFNEWLSAIEGLQEEE